MTEFDASQAVASLAKPVCTHVRGFDELSGADVDWAGGKGANLGELTRAGFPVPPGFVVGATAYAAACDAGGARPRLAALLRDVDHDDPDALSNAAAKAQAIIDALPMPASLEGQITNAYEQLGDAARVAVRSSATAEDTADVSFAGMHESVLNVEGHDALIGAIRACWRSLFGERTIYYRARHHLPQAELDIAVVVQLQIDARRSGVLFTSDPATGDATCLTIEAAVGLGETVVAGEISPDRFVVRKADHTIVARELRHQDHAIEALAGGGTRRRQLGTAEAGAAAIDDDAVMALARLGNDIERHYRTPQDIEWAIDAQAQLWVVQSRPITTLGRHAPKSPVAAAPLARGLAAAPGRAHGAVRIVSSPQHASDLRDGDVLVAPMTTPDWVPLLRRAAALVTDSGGVTCHAAIVARELGIPAVVGAGNATEVLKAGAVVTVDGTRGEVLAGAAAEPDASVAVRAAASTSGEADRGSAPITATRVMLNLSDPARAAKQALLASDGVGLLRAELMLVHAFGGEHPQQLIAEGRTAEAIDRMASSIASFSSAFAGRPVTYRTIDFRSSEFRNLRGGEAFEPVESNPMIGLRGALRAIKQPELLQIELDALSRVWDDGATNVHLMLPFVRSADEVARCRRLISASGLLDRPGFELWVMAEVPSVLFELDSYRQLGVTGISIGSNDLTQLLLAADRDSALVADAFNASSPAVLAYLDQLIDRAATLGLRTSICGQAASVDAAFVERLIAAGIEAVSVTPDALDRTRRTVATAEQRLLLRAARCPARSAT